MAKLSDSYTVFFADGTKLENARPKELAEILDDWARQELNEKFVKRLRWFAIRLQYSDKDAEAAYIRQYCPTADLLIASCDHCDPDDGCRELPSSYDRRLIVPVVEKTRMVEALAGNLEDELKKSRVGTPPVEVIARWAEPKVRRLHQIASRLKQIADDARPHGDELRRIAEEIEQMDADVFIKLRRT